MANGEKMVWAAVFASEFKRIYKKPSYLGSATNEKIKEWEEGVILAAIECAGHAIRYLKEAKKTMKEGWKGYDVLDYYLEMLGEDK